MGSRNLPEKYPEIDRVYRFLREEFKNLSLLKEERWKGGRRRFKEPSSNS